MKYTIIFLLLALLVGCAKQTSPTGGAKDETSPELRSSTPKNGSVNFKDSKIELTFSEYIQLDKPKEQIIISPAVKETESTFKKNKVTILFKEKLKDSTTYSINFRDAVKDLTEKNPAKNLKLAFSTGAYLDSLSISGQAFDLLSNKALKNVTVAVHYASDTFNIFKHKADIFTKADDNTGLFLIENLKSAAFSIYAFQDKNNNLVVDSRNETYAFLTETLNLNDSLYQTDLPLVALDARPLKLINAKPYKNYFSIKANKFIQSYTLLYTNKQKAIHSIAEDLNSIKLYQTFDVPDSTEVRLHIQDSVGNNIDTTFYAIFNKKVEKVNLEKSSIEMEKPFLLLKTNELSSIVRFNKPIKTINFDSIYYQVDSATRFNFTAQELYYDTTNLTISLTKKLPFAQNTPSNNTQGIVEPPKERPLKGVPKNIASKPKKVNELTLGKGAFITIDNDSTVTTKSNVSTYKEEDLSVVLIDKKLIPKNSLIQLLDTKGKILHSINMREAEGFYNLFPGEYKLRIVVDSNNNQKWDAGNYALRIEPEKIFYYYDDNGAQKFSIKANWEYGPLLITPTYRVEKLSTKRKN
jgi:Bacterial Ig-like domain